MRYIQSGMAVLFKPLKVWALPVHLIIEPTTFCPLKCRMCKREKYVASPSHMSFEGFKRIFDQIRPLRLTLSGLGESLVNPALVDMISYANKNGAQVSTTSSLALSGINMEQLVVSGLKRLKVSLDAADAQTYQHIRGLDLFDRVVDNIRTIVALKQKKNTFAARMDSSLPYLCLQVVIQSKNVFQLSQIVELAHDLGVNTVSFRPVGLAGIEEKRDELIAGLTTDEVICQMKKARDTAKKIGMKTNLNDLLTGTFHKTWDVVCNKGNQNIQDCSFPWFSMYITVDGEVKPCCMFSYLDAKFGNLWQEDIHAIWNNAKYQGFRQVLKNGKYPDVRCQGCVPENMFDLAAALRRITT
ncbi:MAG: radical SAM protein [bacterium]|nr:radical SAM protein [bacterium]